MHLYIHFIIAVTHKAAAIQEEWEDQLHEHITETVRKNHHKLIAINSLPDHVHILINMNASQSISSLIDLIKEQSADYINDKKFTPIAFRWQDGYGAFSNSLLDIPKMTEFIKDQKVNHRNITFREEFIAILNDNRVEYDEKELFHELLD